MRDSMPAPRSETAAAPLAPARGRLARLLGPFHVTGSFWYKFHLYVVRRAPSWVYPPLVHLFTLFFFLPLRRIRRALAANLEVILGPCGFLERQRRIYRTLLEFGWCLHERYELYSGRPSPHVVVENRSAWDTFNASAPGFLVLTAHLGNYDVSSTQLSVEGGRRVHVVREQELTAEAQRVMRDLVERLSGAEFVTHFAGDPALSLHLAESLARGEIVALQGDRPRVGGRTLDARMFGRVTHLPVGPVALARLSGAPIVPTFSFRTGRWSYRITIGEPIRVPRTNDRQRDLEVAMTEVARALEGAIATRPYQWFCFAEMWPEDGSASSR